MSYSNLSGAEGRDPCDAHYDPQLCRKTATKSYSNILENSDDSWSNALGYGFWCGKNCAERKIAAGIPPLGAKRAQKGQDAASDAVLAQAALESTRGKEEGWSPIAVAGVVGASLLGIALMVVIIKKAKK